MEAEKLKEAFADSHTGGAITPDDCWDYSCHEYKDAKNFENLNPVGIHWNSLVEHSQMSTHVPGFQSFSRFFCFGQIGHQQHKS